MLNFFRLTSIIEGLSLVALLFIAMPLKYQFSMPEAVKIVGPIHGLLWLAYIVISLVASQQQKWSVLFWALLLILSVMPFGFIITEILIKKKTKDDIQIACSAQ